MKAYDKTKFPNGVRLILIPMEGVGSVATSVMVAVGSRYETPANNGISHFLEHMVFKGTEKYPTTDDVNVIERAGGLQNAYTDIDITNYHNKVLADDWHLALEVNKELVLAPRLEETHVEKERDVILEEMKRSDDEPASKAGETFHSMMYPGARLGMRIIGEVASLKATNADTLRGYHDAWYRPGQMVVTLAGNVGGKENAIKEAVAAWFEPLTGEPVGALERVSTSTQTAPNVEVVTKPDAQQAHLVMGVHTFARGSEDRFGWNLFNLIMGVSFTSRLFKEIREKRGLCYHIRSSSDNWTDTGYWSIYAGVATTKVEEAVGAIRHEMEKAVSGGVTDNEVMVAKKRLKTLLAFRMEDPEFMGEWYGRQELFGESKLTLEQYIQKIEAVTREEINALTKKYLDTRGWNMAIVWNKKKDKNFRPF